MTETKLDGTSCGSGKRASSCPSFLGPQARPALLAVSQQMGPSPHRAGGFSSAADTNRIRDDILPG